MTPNRDNVKKVERTTLQEKTTGNFSINYLKYNYCMT